MKHRGAFITQMGEDSLSILGIGGSSPVLGGGSPVLGGTLNTPKKLHTRQAKPKPPSIAANLFRRKEKKKKKHEEEVPIEVHKTSSHAASL